MPMDKGKLNTDLTNFTILHNEFIESEWLSCYEKMVFIGIKRHLNWQRNDSFPSINTLCKYTQLSRPTVIKTIKSLTDKKIIKVVHRTDPDKGNISNLYTLYDYKDLWKAKDSKEVETIAEEYENNRMIQMLEAKGYKVSKEKGLASAPTKVTETSTYNNLFDINNDTPDLNNCQQIERYSMGQIMQFYNYEIMVHDYPEQQTDIDSVISILHTTLNSTKEKIRVCGEDKPCLVVQAKLLKLSYQGIMYAIKKYKEQIEPIKNPINYILTLLFKAEEQLNFDIINTVQYALHHPEPNNENE